MYFKESIEKYFEGVKSKKVLIIGDVMVDSYMWGDVKRISPEAPIPIVSVTNREYRLGGASNVALNIKALGAEPFLCSVIGNDEKGLVFKSLLKDKNLSCEGILELEDRKTIVKTRIISNGQHLLRVDDEDTSLISDEVQMSLFYRLESIVKKENIDIIIFEDYDKGVLSEILISKICDFAKRNNVITCVDPKKNNFDFYSEVDFFKPNLKEFNEGLKCNINDVEALKVKAQEFLSATKIGVLMITLSEKGVLILNKNQSYHFPTVIRKISDVSGAGDTVISVASLLMSMGAPIDIVASVSNIAGGLVCGKSGVVSIDQTELLSEIRKL